MLVSHAHKFMFFHIRKTGGTSIACALNGIADDPYGDRHLRASHVRERLPEQFKKYFKWSVVRNPFDRMVSMFSFDSEITKAFQPGGLYHGIDFARYCQIRLIEEKGHWASPQVDFLKDNDTWLVDRAIRFEQLQQEFDEVCYKVNLARIELPKRRVSLHGDYHDYYDDSTRQLVADVFARDLEEFGYTF